ncbi:MAG: CatB-related O-acetyltransferase [Lachnospiraceae bacterium]
MNIIRLLIFRRKWRKQNEHNGTWVKSLFNPEQVSVGKGTYGEIRLLNDVEERKLKIGNYCSIGGETLFLLGREHDIGLCSTFPFKVRVMGDSYEALSKGDIIVDDDVWIGCRAMILSGVHIGQGAVIAAGSVVNKDVPPYAVVGGVPAKIMKYRFSDELIDELLKVDYSKLDDSMVKEHIGRLYEKLEDRSQLEWLPKKEV